MLQENVKAAVEYAEGQIRRLLSGQVELWELPLTGGLWRVTGVFSILLVHSLVSFDYYYWELYQCQALQPYQLRYHISLFKQS